MRYTHSSANKEVFTKYVRERFKDWNIKSIKVLKPAMKTFPGTYEAILTRKIHKRECPECGTGMDEEKELYGPDVVETIWVCPKCDFTIDSEYLANEAEDNAMERYLDERRGI